MIFIILIIFQLYHQTNVYQHYLTKNQSYLRIMSDVLGVKDYSEILDSVNPENSKKLKR